jgi:hypothetical protein
MTARESGRGKFDHRLKVCGRLPDPRRDLLEGLPNNPPAQGFRQRRQNAYY